MLLYHGSYTIIKRPHLLKNQRMHDFGDGFYLTTDKEQAKKWARIVYNRIQKTQLDANPIVNIYNIRKVNINSLNILYFPKQNIEWLNFITLNRIIGSINNAYDISIGPVADSKPYNILLNYKNDIIDAKTAIQLLHSERLSNQYVFKTNKAIKFLEFRGEEHV